MDEEQNSSQRREQLPLVPLSLDISGDPQIPRPVVAVGDRCNCCGLRALKLWSGARSGAPQSIPVCTLCYLAGHLDSPTAAHGRLAYLPGLAMPDAHHLQRMALIAINAGTKNEKREGLRVWRSLIFHAREVESSWGTARAGEFAAAMKRLPPSKRADLQSRLSGCVLILPPDAIEDLSLLLPAGKSAAAVLATRSWSTYTRSDLYVETSAMA